MSSLTPFSFIFTSTFFFFFWRFAFGVTTFGDRWPRAGIEPLGLALEGVRGAISFAWSSALPHANASRNSVNILKQFSIFLRHFLRTDLLPSSLSWMTTILNSRNNSTRMTGFSHKTLENSLFEVSGKKRYCGDTLSIHWVKIFEANCADILGNHFKHGRNCIICSNSRRCDLRCMQLNMTAGSDSDWLIRTLTLVTLWGGGRLQ